MKIAIITGASSGMGREFVYALDRDEAFDELWVIARRKERLEALQAQTRARVRVMALDLLDERSFESSSSARACEAMMGSDAVMHFPPRASHASSESPEGLL